MNRKLLAPVLACLPLIGLADEGMWTIDNFPTDVVAEKYGVRVGDQWLKSAQLSTTRLEGGCTGSFASADGLVLTNNHCTWSCIRNLSTDEHNLSDEGFMAATRDEELVYPAGADPAVACLSDLTGQFIARCLLQGFQPVVCA